MHLDLTVAGRFHSPMAGELHGSQSRSQQKSSSPSLLHCMVFYVAFFGFQFVSEHVPGVLNTAADAISRNNVTLLNFVSIIPQVSQVPIPQVVVVSRKPDWGSRDWTKLFGR